VILSVMNIHMHTVSSCITYRASTAQLYFTAFLWLLQLHVEGVTSAAVHFYIPVIVANTGLDLQLGMLYLHVWNSSCTWDNPSSMG